MPSSTLFVRNKTDEFIGHVAVNRENIPDKLIVGGYTRDSNVFNHSTCDFKFSLTCDHPNFIGFSKYLNGRKKAAVITFQLVSGEKDIMYILPSTHPSHLTEVSCLLSSDIKRVTTSLSVKPLPREEVGLKSASKPPPISASSPVCKPAPAKMGSNFLSNLLSKVEADVVSYTKTPLVKAEVLNAVGALQARVRDALHSLDGELQGGRTMVAFEPMEPEQRYLVHEVVDDFDNLIGVSEGEDIDRHVVVYKKGFEPVLEEAEAVPAVVVPVSRTASRRKGGVAPPAPCAPSNMVKVSTVKRDRRTIEDYQNDKKRKLN